MPYSFSPKRLVAFLGILGLSVGATLAQPTRSQPFKHANTFILRTTDKQEPALRTLQALLVQQGFTIRSTDDSTNVITGFRTLRQGNKVDSLQVFAGIGSKAADQPSVTRLLLFSLGPLALAYRGQESSLSRQAFQLVEAVAKAYPRAELRYQANQ